MTDQELQLLVHEISMNVFKKPFLHQARFNGRLRTTGGRYMLGDHSIQINPLVLEKHGLEEVIGVIKHELCHYHLHLEGKGYKHRDEDFKRLLKETGSPRYCQPLVESRRSSVTRFYRCQECNHEYKRKRRVDIKKYRCGKCRGHIIEVTHDK